MPNLWPFVPLMNISETLEHLSNVFTTRTTEQRLALRYQPRQTLMYVTHHDNYTFARAKAFAAENADVSVYVPVWLEAVRLQGVAALDTELFLDTSYGDWRVGSQLVIWQSYDNYSVIPIQSINPTSIILEGPPAQEFQQPYVIPVRECLAKQGYQFARTALMARVTAVFSVMDNIQLIPDDATTLDGYPVYNNLIVMKSPPYELAQTSENIIRPTVYFDNGFGPQVGEVARIVNDFGQMMSFFDNIGPQLWDRRKFLHWIRGKQVPFWFPTYNKDLQLVSPITAVATSILVRSITDTPSYYVGKHIMILLKNGTTYFRQVTGASAQVNGDQLNITALGAAVSLDALNLICFLTKVRSNTDSFTFAMTAPNMVSMTMPVSEVPE
jgi:hypothetical protein